MSLIYSLYNERSNEEVTFYTAEKAANYIAMNITREDFDEMLDTNYDQVEIMAIKFYPSYVLKNVSHEDYRILFIDWQDDEHEEIERQIDELLDGGELTFYGVTVTAMDADAMDGTD